MEHGALVTEIPENNTSEVYHDLGPRLEAGDVIVDTGCRTAVAGGLWHEQHQQKLKQLGLTWETVSQDELFKFGAGDPVRSTRAFLCPVATHGAQSWVRVSEVGEGAQGWPGLMGPSEMTRWSVELHFGTRSMCVLGSSRAMRLSNTRHPVLQLLEVEHGSPPDMLSWYQGELGVLARRLREDPAQMAFFEQGAPTSPSAAPESSEEEEQQELTEEVEDSATNLTIKGVADLQERLSHEVEVSYGLLQDAFRDKKEDASESSLGSISEAQSETSHELGAPSSEDDGSTSSEEQDERERHEALYASEMQPFAKGQRRRVTNAASQILIGHDYEKQAERERRMAEKIRAPRVPRSLKRLGWKILELFTWSCLVSRIAYTQGWQFCEAVTIPHWDITNPVDFEQALDYIDREDPDLLIIARPCTKWSSYQRLTARTHVQRAALEQERREQTRTFLSLSGRAASLQRQRGKAVIGENPASLLAWSQPEIAHAFEGLSFVQYDQCQYGLKHPETGEPIRKGTQFAGHPTVVKYLTKKHAHIEGAVHVEDMSVSLVTWCGAYPPELCRAILRGATEYLTTRPEDEGDMAYFEDVFAEEALMDGR